jgi:23S rRNA (guanosine2251-2'-O)-methyltransferase
MPESQIFFLECQNPACGLRFPLDLAQFEGKYCPRCGSILTKDSPRLKSQSFLSGQKSPKVLIAILDNVRSAHNVGSIFRSADGAGFGQIHLCGITPTPDENPAIAKTALGAEKSLAWQYSPNAVQIIRVLKTQGVMILALETTPQALSLYELKSSAFPKDPAIALIVGNEPAGVDPKLIALADACLYIPMLGQKTSLNVSIAFSLAAYHLRFLY